MGAILYDYYSKAGEIGGVKGRTKLSFLTKTSSIQAKSLTDSPENIEKFEKAMKEVTLEFKPLSENNKNFSKTKEDNCDNASHNLRRYMLTLVDLSTQREVLLGSLDTLLKRITEAITFSVEVDRASVWFWDEDKEGILCKELFTKSTGVHSSGDFLAIDDYPTYFKALKNERTLAANKAQTDARTKEFTDGYLRPKAITSMLDVPIWVNDKWLGVVCYEHVGTPRHWTMDEENFGYLMSNFIAMAVEFDLK